VTRFEVSDDHSERRSVRIHLLRKGHDEDGLP
jgi:hypothetical protein